MKFCTDCKSLLKSSTASGVLVFECVCGKQFPSLPEDTLRYEEHFEVRELGQNFDVMINNSPFDLAGQKVKQKCKACGNIILTLVYIGTAEIPKLVCECGAQYDQLAPDAVEEETGPKK